MGRPSEFTEEIADAICERMIEGESLVDICADEAMPSRKTVYRWMEAHPDFDTRCARARDGQADFMDHEIVREAKAATPETAQVARVRIAAYQWRASKLAPKRYGDRMALVGGGKGEDPIDLRVTDLTDDDLAAIARAGGNGASQ